MLIREILEESVQKFGEVKAVKWLNRKEVRSGFECGLVMESYNDIKEGDQIESFIMEEVPR